MPMCEKAKVIDALYRMPFSNQEIVFQDMLIEKGINLLGKSTMDAEAWAQSNLQSIWNTFLFEQESNNIKGIVNQFVIIDAARKKIRFISTGEFPRSQYKAALLKAWPLILQEIDKFDSRQFEAMGVFINRLLGAKEHESVLTPAGNEGGVDFYSAIRFINSAHYLFGIKGPIRIIGQSKKYSSKVQVSKMKEFLRTIEDVKTQGSAIINKVPPWFYTFRGHIAGWMIAHKGFQSGAIDRAKNNGILVSDSVEVSQLIALSRNFAPYESPENRSRLFVQKVNSILV